MASINGHENGISMDYNDLQINGTSGDHKVAASDESFLRRLFELIIKEGVQAGTNRNTKVVEFVHPKDLKLRLDLDLGEEGSNEEQLLNMCADTIKYSVKTGHPRFFNQLFGGLDRHALGGTWLTEALNTSQYTFEVAPVFTLMEQVVLGKLQELVGYTNGDGIFCPGGSVSNMYGLNIARYSRWPEVKTEGMQALPRLCIFTSEHAHYSVKKGAALLGLGINNIRLVKCNGQGKMIVSDLERNILAAQNEGFTPFLVNATGGTTVAGAYDPLDEIASVCAKHGVWMHVDACWGGGALLSAKHKHLLKGIDRADSVSWNPHKMMGVPLQCCAFLTKHRNLLQQAHSANAQYLFQQDKFYDISYDTGDKSVQCGRKVDVFKIWLMWKAKGNAGFEKGMNNIFECAKYLAEAVRRRPGFRLVYAEPECTNVCFWYIPPSMRGQEEDDDWWQRLSKVAPAVKESMVMEGTMLIGYQPQPGLVNFFRMVISNTETQTQDMDFVLDEIDRLGASL